MVLESIFSTTWRIFFVIVSGGIRIKSVAIDIAGDFRAWIKPVDGHDSLDYGIHVSAHHAVRDHRLLRSFGGSGLFHRHVELRDDFFDFLQFVFRGIHDNAIALLICSEEDIELTQFST